MINKKIIGILVCMLFFGTSFIPAINCDIIKENDIKNSSWDQTISDIINESLLDLKFIHRIAENLSNIIFTQYDESAGELAKGRDFGSKGEHEAARILEENMSELGLWTWNESIENIEEMPNIARKIDINERGLSVINTTSEAITQVGDFYITGRSNLTHLYLYLEDMKGRYPLLVSILTKLLTMLIFPINGRFDQKYNLYDTERLTHNFSYKGLKVIKKPYNYSFRADKKNETNNGEPYVYIYLDGAFTSWPFPLEETKFNGIIYKIMLKIVNIFGGNNETLEQLIWTLLYPNCKGMIKVDSNNDTYNMGNAYSTVPLISVNKTIGWDIYKNPKNYNIDFYVNQSWNDSVGSYNVIGQINGTEYPNVTVIVCSLYDSLWCQGTGDAAIAMAMVLGIAKYFNDSKIKPKCNVKFIAFGAEEYAFRGAYYYEIVHPEKEEYIPYVIDINQVGFTPLIPENIKLQMWVNNQTLNETIGRFAEETNYTKRTGVGFQTVYKESGGPSNTKAFATATIDGERSCNTIMIVKTGIHTPGGRWLNHHRDGLNHKEGDVMTYFNWLDTSITGELVYNVTKYFTNDTTYQFRDY